MPPAISSPPETASARPDSVLHADVAVIGGGVIGHAIAWEARRSGRSVVLIDDAPGRGATWAAAGMLAPVSELHYQEEDLLALMLTSSGLWPAFAADLALAGAGETGYLTTPTLAIGADAADRRALMDLRAVQQASGLVVEPLTVREARSRESLLSPAISCALDIPADHQVDPRRLVACLQEVLALHEPGTETAVAGARGGFAVDQRAAAVLWEDGRVSGVALADGGIVQAGETIVANGLQAASLEGLPVGLYLPLRPVYGDILRLAVPQHLRPLLTSTVRGIVHGVPVYIVPRGNGTVVIGATQREDALAGTGDGAVSAGGVYQLLRDAQVLVPAVSELELLECTARARPATPDNAPLLGRVPVSAPGTGNQESLGNIAGLIVATGFFRHGVLLAPAAAAICRDLLDGRTDPRWGVLNPARFSSQHRIAGTQSPPKDISIMKDLDPQKESA
ncbi:glycine oxidase ThiO [Pseudarthrobacter sp. NBSH8]|uniref:glycine oxidase ThiO n=1 Tax=Pseudarthrobacter sp. NBSH8 TaxID=2596911 RepID=UPI0016254DFB|nr:glycine oxidase ThiO [Pseudarthrobacter sp. NBSH8]QNE15248.1 glycine oxidase ThiO [Pseudarthrobacter sp. NBSH8]